MSKLDDDKKAKVAESTPEIPSPEENVSSESLLPDQTKPKNKFMNKWVIFGTSAIVILLAGTAAFAGYMHFRPYAANEPNQTTAMQSTDPYAGWKTYSSPREKASFKYPSNWTVTSPVMVSNDSNNTDQVGIKSPSGAITISYVTTLVGFGDEHTDSYPLNEIVDKSPITGAPGLYAISGITTLDGKIYHPWIAVQDSNGVITSGVMGDVITFTSHWATDTDTNDFTGILFSTSAARTQQDSPSLTKAQAEAWFNGTEVKQAKLIFLSFQDAANPYSGFKTYISKLGGVSIKYPSDWTAPYEPYNTTIMNGTVQEEYMSWQSPFADFDGQQRGISMSLTALTGYQNCDANLPVFKIQDITTADGHHLSMIVTASTNQIEYIYLTDVTNLKAGDNLPTCSATADIKSSLSQTKTLQITVQFIIPCAPGDHCGFVNSPLTPDQYSRYSVVSQIVKSFESLTFN